MIGAFGEQALDQRGVGPVGLEHRVGDALQWILVVVEARGPEREVKIDDDGIKRKVACDRPGDIVRDGGRAHAALGADDRDDASGRHRILCGEEAADRSDHVERLDRTDHVVVDAAAHQFPIGHVIVGAADHDDAGAGIAMACQLIEAVKDIAAAVGLEDDHVRRRHPLIDVDRGRDAAHLDSEMRLGQAAVFARRTDRGRGFLGLAERLHRYARHRRNVVLGRLRSGFRRVFGILAGDARHLPVSLSLALSASG